MAPSSHSVQVRLAVRAQLEFMEKCIENGRSPTPEETARVKVGPIAVKNFDDTHPEYAHGLMAVDYGFCHWDERP